MSTAFEYLNKDARRIAFPRFSLAIFVAAILIFVMINLVMSTSASHLQRELSISASRVEFETQKGISGVPELLPAVSEIDELVKLTAKHNQSVVGPSSVWTRFFNSLEKVLPSNVVITSIENPLTNKPVFNAVDRAIRLKIAVPGIDVANSLYMNLSEVKAFTSLSFTPKGEIQYQGRKCLSIELLFTYNEKYE